MGSELNLPIKWSVSIGTKLNFDGETHGHSDGDDKCKQPLDFLTNQVNHSKNGLQPQLARHDANVDTEAPTKSLTLNFKRALIQQ